MERGYLLRDPGETERAGETHRARDRQIETEEFKAGLRERETLKRHPGRDEVFLFPFHQAVKHFLFLAHFPDCKTLSIGQPYEVTI